MSQVGYTQRSAIKAFGIVGHPASSDGYVTVPLARDEEQWSLLRSRQILEEPVAVLMEPDRLLGKSFLGVIMGAAGVGKSELIRQLCRSSDAEAAKVVFPIRLSSCRARQGSFSSFMKDLTPAKLAEFLFDHLADEAQLREKQHFIISCFEELRTGIILALDGLDEIVATREQHKVFFQVLWKLLAEQLPRTHLRVLVTYRTDYAENLGIRERADFGDYLAQDHSIRLHFMSLNFFNAPQVRAYLLKQQISSGPLKEKADRLNEDASGIGEIMQRPLLLRLLCDLAPKGDPAALPSSITELLDELTKSAAVERNGDPMWTRQGLGVASLELFKKRQSSFGAVEFRVSDIDGILALKDGRPLSQTERLSAIHLCPFLRHDAEGGLQFTHLIFYDYFVALGMFLQVEQEQGPSRLDFDRYVLSPDMRRFLRGMLGEKRWRDRTAYSYCMADEKSYQHWPLPEWASEHKDELERIRWTLLQFITDPEETDPNHVVLTLREFLNLQHTLLFPAYRMYNIEAVAVFIWTYQWLPAATELSLLLREQLLLLLQQAGGEAREHIQDGLYIDALERLILRTLQLARRLRMEQVVKKVDAPAFAEWIQDENTKAEIRALQRERVRPGM